MYSLALGGLFGYLLGSVPTAFLIVRRTSKIDIRHAGSGNVGTLNSYQVTRSRTIGVLVLVLDFLKGFLPVMACKVLGDGNWELVAGAGIGAVTGHNFPVWLGFKGGRGLATGAGVLSVLSFPLIIVWGIVWGAGFLLIRAVNVANVIATFFLVIILWVASDSQVSGMVTAMAAPDAFRWFATILLLIILIRHVRPLLQFIETKGT